jgi:CHAD domain-containing protein
MALLTKVLADDSGKAVHDLRVWSRRLQQVVTILAPSPRPHHARTVVRALRRARHAVGGWRDCDVLLELLESKARRIRNPEERKVRETIRALAESRRQRQMRRARRKLESRKLFTLAHRAERFLDELAGGQHKDTGETPPREVVPRKVLTESIVEGYAHWREALTLACDSLAPANIHAFRIRSKKLRYRLELARDLGEHNVRAALGPLKSLQDELGDWHDRLELFRLTAEALANPELLLKHPRLVATVLRKSDRERALEQERIRRLLAKTLAHVDGSALHDWVLRYCRTQPPNSPAAPEPRSAEPALDGNESARAACDVAMRSAGHAPTLETERVGENFIKATGDPPN